MAHKLKKIVRASTVQSSLTYGQYIILSISACNVGSNTWPIKSSTGQEEVDNFWGILGKIQP